MPLTVTVSVSGSEIAQGALTVFTVGEYAVGVPARVFTSAGSAV